MGSGYRTFTAGEVLTASNVQNYLQDQAVMVFAGTAARSSAIGTANFEEGMLTYLTDVDKLQVYTGATFADVYPAAASTQGLTLINTTSFSGVASQAVNGCFSATYQNYKIIFTLTSATADATIKARLRSGTTDNSASFYNFAMPGLTNGGSAANESSGPSSGGFLITYSDSSLTHYSSASIDLYKPFLAVYTTGTITMTNSSFSLVLRANSGGLWHEVSSSFDGINFIADAGNITGEVSIYGYNK